MRGARWLAIFVAVGVIGASAAWFLGMPEKPSGRPEVLVRVVGYQWAWEFFVDDGSGIVLHTVGEATVGVGRHVRLVVESLDVVHSFYCPDFALKVDAIPGVQTTRVFQPSQAGDIRCLNAEYSGAGHSQMVAVVHVVNA